MVVQSRSLDCIIVTASHLTAAWTTVGKAYACGGTVTARMLTNSVDATSDRRSRNLHHVQAARCCSHAL